MRFSFSPSAAINSARCAWEDITAPDARGYRKVRCKKCGLIGVSNGPHEKIVTVGGCGGAGPAPAFGPGTELTKLLAELRAVPTSSCRCRERAEQMDRWGIEGCREHRAEIIGWLQEAYAAVTWGQLIHCGRQLLAEPWFRLADPFGSLLDEAVRRAAAKATGFPSDPTPSAP